MITYLLQFLQLLDVFISAIASLVGITAGIPIGIPSSAIGLKICVITVDIENYKSMIKKKKEEAR